MTRTKGTSVLPAVAARDEGFGYENTCSFDESAGRMVREMLDRVGDKWSLLLVATLQCDRMRFTELLQRIPGISQRMLTRTLRQLERDGLVERTAHAEVPPRVEYELTPLGATLVPIAVTIGTWALAHQPEVEAARARYDSR
ncbi:winged helix-turn-helix transcriptional regulator [Microbacterium sp. GXF6406]